MHRAGDYPETDQELFQLLARAIFQTGLGPKIVEIRWPTVLAAMDDLDPAVVAGYTDQDVCRLMVDPGMIRNRRKVETIIWAARIWTQALTWNLIPQWQESIYQLYRLHGFHAAGRSLCETFPRLLRPTAELFLFAAGFRFRPAGDDPERACYGGAR